MSTPTIYDKHVNSVYLRRDDYGHGYEGGWWWKKVDGQPRYFAVRVQSWKYFEYPKAWATPSTNNVLFSVQIDNNDNQTARVKRQINGGTVVIMYDSYRDTPYAAANFAEGVATWGSERNLKNENNYGHFWGLMKKRHDQSWVNWETQGLYGDNDNAGSPVPTSDGYYRREINETDAYSQKEGT